VVFRAKGALAPRGLTLKPAPPQNRRKRGNAGFVDDGRNTKDKTTATTSTTPTDSDAASAEIPAVFVSESTTPSEFTPASTPPIQNSPTLAPAQLSTADALSKLAAMEPQPDPTVLVQSENLYCPECYLPLHPDPKPEKLYIFLHALRYTTSLGCFETEMPEWAAEGWTWDWS
jgi:tRNA pseudouridine synthase 9